MPNWCYNSLVVKGKDDDLKQMVSLVHGEQQPLSFHKIVPEPPGLTEESQGDALSQTLPSGEVRLPGWYEWRCTNWGTKWDVDGGGDRVDVILFPGKIEFVYSTAWSPSLPISETLSQKFPGISFDHIFSDESMDMAGRVVWKVGGVALQREYHHGSAEYEAICRGFRPEDDGVQLVDWVADVPVNSGLSEAGVDCSQLHGIAQEGPQQGRSREDLVREALLKMEQCRTLGNTIFKACLERAEGMGFPLEKWQKAGMDKLPEDWAWNGGIPDAKIPPQEQGGVILDCVNRAGAKNGAGGPRLVLRDFDPRSGRKGKPDVSAGEIRFLSHGFEIRVGGGWSVSGLLRGAESGCVTVSHRGEAQNWMDGQASCVEFRIDGKTGNVYKAGLAHCVDGKLWNPDRQTPALQLWYPNGQPKFTGNFFDGKNQSKDGTPPSIHYDENGEVSKQARRKLRKPIDNGGIPPAPVEPPPSLII